MRAALAAGIKCFNVESEPELERLDADRRALGGRAPVSLRINPDVDARTHPYISTGMAGNKFGIPHDRALEAYRHAARLREPRGDRHRLPHRLADPRNRAARRGARARARAGRSRSPSEGIALEHVDLGGGFGIRYRDEDASRHRRLLPRASPRRLRQAHAASR